MNNTAKIKKIEREVIMTAQEAHNKVGYWMNIEKKKYLISNVNKSHFGKVDLHSVIDEILGEKSDTILINQIKKNNAQLDLFYRLINEEATEETKKYYSSKIIELRSQNEEINNLLAKPQTYARERFERWWGDEMFPKILEHDLDCDLNFIREATFEAWLNGSFTEEDRVKKEG